jgi:hypothetical protein
LHLTADDFLPLKSVGGAGLAWVSPRSLAFNDLLRAGASARARDFDTAAACPAYTAKIKIEEKGGNLLFMRRSKREKEAVYEIRDTGFIYLFRHSDVPRDIPPPSPAFAFCVYMFAAPN